MKKILVAAAILLALQTSAQMKEGRIVYERTIQMPQRMFRNVDPGVAAQLPKSRTDQFELLFTSNQSLWQYLPNAANENDGNTVVSGGTVLRFNGGANEVSYFNFEKGMRTDQREIMERSFVVTDSIRKLEWKLTDDTKDLLGHSVRKALATRVSTRMQMSMENGEMKRTPIQDTSQVEAWFATDMPVPAGPEYGGQLPGVILELNIGNGQTVYRAIEISPKVNAAKVKEPREGKKVTAAEFAKERDKIFEEMRQNSPNGMIRIQN